VFEFTLRCPKCHEALEFRLPYAELLEAERPALEVVTVALGDGASVGLRLPTGSDQAAWHAQSFDSQEELWLGMLESLAVTPLPLTATAEPEFLERCSEALAAGDPLTAFDLVSSCPGCANESTFSVDLEALVLERLATEQRQLVEQVHRFALRYGWTENETFGIPAWRRGEYLKLLREDAAAP